MRAISPRVLIALALLVCAFSSGRAEAASVPLDWASTPTPIENLRPYGPWYQLRAASCPTPTFCVAVDGEGSAFVSSDPGGGPEAWTLRRLPIRADDVACPSVTLCLAVGENQIATASDPLDGRWTTSPLGSPGPEAIECPSTALCVAYERTYGLVWTATNPTGGAAAWTSRTVPIQLKDLSCPTTTLCVGAGSFAQIVTSTDPTGPASSWPATVLEGLNQPLSVSCGSAALCLVASSQGSTLATSTDPTGGAAAWTLSRFELGLDRVHCASSTLCFASENYTDRFYTSTTPGGGAASFDRGALAGHVLTCAGTAFCLGGDRTIRAAVLTSHAPAGGVSQWTRTPLTSHGVRALTGVACPSSTRCLVATEDARIVSSTTPTGPLAGWSHEADLAALGADALTALACGVSRCVAGDASGGLFEGDAAGTWRRTAGETGAAVLGAACAGDALCAATDEAGDVRRSDGAGWRTESVARTALNGIACPSVELCVAVGDDGRAYHSHSAGWSSQRVSSDGALLSVACPTTRLCAAGSEDGVFTTVAPASEFQWIERELYEGAMTGIACPSVSLCVAVSDTGSIFASAEPSTGEMWEESDAYGPMTAVACAGDAVCLAVDEEGYAFVGTARGLPYATSAPRIEAAARPGDTLHCDPGTWTGSPTLAYEWEWRGRLIEDATGPTFALRDSDGGQAFSCRVTAVNGWGKAVATSGATIVSDSPRVLTTRVFPVVSAPPGPIVVPAPFTGRLAIKPTKLATLLKRGLPVTVTCSHACSITVRLVPDAATAKRLGLKRGAAFGSAKRVLAAGRAATLRVRLSAAAQRAIKRKRVRSLRFTVAATEAGKRAVTGGKTLTVRG